MKKKILVVSLVFILLLSACAKASNTVAPQVVEQGRSSLDAAGEKAVAPAMESPLASSESQSTVDRLVIRTASMRVSVADPAQSVVALTNLANTEGGFVVSSNTWTNTASSGATFVQSSITIRVPSEKLDSVMAKIRAMAADVKNGVLSESISGQDVTSDYTDSQSQLRNLEAAEQQLVKLLDSASSLEYTLDIFRELTAKRGEIEVLKGHIKYLEESAALSAVTVEFVAEASLQPIEIGGWKPEGVMRDAIQSLINAAQGFATFLIKFVIIWLPFLIPLGLIVYLIVKGIKKARAKRREMTYSRMDQSKNPPKS